MSHFSPCPKGQPVAKAKRKPMRRVAKGKKSSSDCPIMRSAEGEQCLADWCGCGGSTDTTCLRHIRKFGAGGAGMKPPPFIGFYGCFEAERLWENNKDQPWGWDGVMQAMVLTQLKLYQKGLLGILQEDEE